MSVSEEENLSVTERAAIKQRADELRNVTGMKGAARRLREYEACQAAISALTGNDRSIAERFHVIVAEEAPDLDPRTWYGFPAYAREGAVITFLQPASKFGTRYATVGFTETAALDNGNIWPTSYAVLTMTPDVETGLRELVRAAAAT